MSTHKPIEMDLKPDWLTSNRPLWQSLFWFLIPLVLSNALQSLGGTVSAMILGRGIGEKALAAASTVFPISFFLISLLIGLGSASSILIGQAFGSGSEKNLRLTIRTSFRFAFYLSLFIATFGVLFTEQLLHMIGTPAEVMDMAVSYAKITFASLPFQGLYISYTIYLRGLGDSKTPLYFLILSTVLTLILSPVLAFGWLGFPALHVDGIALANAIAILVTLLALMGYLYRKKHILTFRLAYIQGIKLDMPILKLLLKIGIPTSIQMVFISLSSVAILSLINQFGTKATAVYGAIVQVASYVQLPALSLGMATGIYGSQLIGAGQKEKLTTLLRSAIYLNYAMGMILVGFVYLFSESVLSLFLKEASTLAQAEEILFVILWAYMIFGHSIVLSGLMRSSGTILWPTSINILSIAFVQVPTAYILSKNFGFIGVWFGFPISFLFNMITQFAYYRFFWRHQQHQDLFAKEQKLTE